MLLKKQTRKIVRILSIATLLFLGYSFIEFHWLKTTQLVIQSADIPPAFDGKRIVFFSDVHEGRFFTKKQVAALVQKVNALHPDIVILGGDYVLGKYKGNTYSFFKEIKKLKCPLGVYGVIGNHDYWSSHTLTIEQMQKYGIHDCDNRAFWIKSGGDSIKIGGLHQTATPNQIPDSMTQDVKPTDFMILVSHKPDKIMHLQSNKVDLTLSGHTHGGQITLFGLYAPVLPAISDNGFAIFPTGEYQKYRYGMIQNGSMQSYISSGVGGLLPFRFFCRPEIVVIQLQHIPAKKTATTK